jgi:hypothetical protein
MAADLKEPPMRAAWLAALAIVALTTGFASVRAETGTGALKVLLLTDGTDVARWAPAIPLLEAAGLRVQLLPPAPDDFVDETQWALNDGPTVLVGAGWSGTAISAIGSDHRVKALVYLAASAPEAGEDFNALAARFSVPAEGVKRMEAAAPITRKIDSTALQEKPRFYAVSTQDAALPEGLQRFYAARLKAKTIVLDAMESRPREIAGLILEAAGMKPAACGGVEDDGTGACAAPALPRSLADGCKCTKTPLESLIEP